MELEWTRYPVAVAIGYVIGVIGSGPLIAWTIYLIRGEIRKGTWHTAEMGFVERTIFWLAFLFGRWEVAAAFVALKVAAKWGGWSNRAGIFNLFVIGLGLSLIYAGAGAYLVPAIVAHDALGVAVLLAGPLALNAAVGLLAFGPVSLRRVFNPEAGRELPEPVEEGDKDRH